MPWSPPTPGVFTNHLPYAKWYATQWALRMMDVVNQYDPDFIYTDGTDQQPFSGSGTGSSLDFQDHRAYSPGDDPRHINWQAYARTGSYTMKLFREEVRPQRGRVRMGVRVRVRAARAAAPLVGHDRGLLVGGEPGPAARRVLEAVALQHEAGQAQEAGHGAGRREFCCLHPIARW